MDISVIVGQIAVLFSMIGIGAFITKKGLITQDGSKTLSKVVINVGLPGMTFASVLGGEKVETSVVLMTMFLASLVFLLAIPAIWCFKKAYGFKGPKGGIYAFMILFGNTGFMGFPVVKAIFGDQGLFYASIAVLPSLVLSFSVGMLMVAREAGTQEKINVWDKLAHNMPFLTSSGSIIWYLLGLPVPALVVTGADMLGEMCAPLSMIIIGSSLAKVKLNDVFSDSKIYVMSALRLAIMPVIYYMVLLRFNLSPLVLGVLVVLSAMPVAANCPMFCVEYNADSSLAAKGVFVSTALCIITIPALVLFINRV